MTKGIEKTQKVESALPSTNYLVLRLVIVDGIVCETTHAEGKSPAAPIGGHHYMRTLYL